MANIFVPFLLASFLLSLGNDVLGLNRIIGGRNTKIENYPWHAALQFRDKRHCGASIISKRFLLTAAHCFRGRLELYSVVFGTTDITKPNIVKPLKPFIINENYFEQSINDNDIAIVQLKSDLEFNKKIQPVKLPKEGLTPNHQANIIGWGHTDTNKTNPSILQTLAIEIIDWNKCSKLYRPSKITKSMFCAGNLAGGKDSCQGDSGGSLTVNGVIYGITSWGKQCALPNYPGVYVNVTHFRSWIKKKTGL